MTSGSERFGDAVLSIRIQREKERVVLHVQKLPCFFTEFVQLSRQETKRAIGCGSL